MIGRQVQENICGWGRMFLEGEQPGDLASREIAVRSTERQYETLPFWLSDRGFRAMPWPKSSWS